MELIKLIQTFSNPFLDMFFQLVTMVGEDTFFIFVTAIIYWCIDKELGYKLGFATLTSAALNCGIKYFFKIPRPIGEPGIRSLRVHTAEGYSFPSGHTQNTTTLWTFFMLQFRRSWIYAVGVVMIFMVGLSRLYLGVHTPADVLGGMIIGVIWVLIWCRLYEASERHNNNNVLFITVAFALAGLFVFKDAGYYKVVGALAGLLTGYLTESRFIKFKVKAGILQQVFKVVFGLLAVFVLRLVLKLVLPQALIFDFFRYFALILWVTVVAPLTFKRFSAN
ncbi:MAG TPA: phosphatase PAP2 family protein [Clostridia bacterium]|nr:phosphatase PAP2 family protein [Clostridia bacterium]